MPYKKTTMKKVTTMIALFFFLLSQSVAVAGNRSSRKALLDKLDQLDRLDFDRELSEFNQCFTKLDTGCAREHLQKAKLYSVDTEDTTKIKKLNTMIDGVEYVIKSAKCIKSHSFTCAKNNMEKAEKIDGTETYRTLLRTNRQRYLAEKADYDREQQRLAETRRNSSHSYGRHPYQPSRGAATAGALLGAAVVIGGLAKLAQAVLGSGSSNSGSTHHDATAIIPPFSSCDELYNNCKAICNGKSDRTPILSLYIGDKGKCEDKCTDAMVTCERQRDGSTDTLSDDYAIRGKYCTAICVGTRDEYGCREKCRNNYNFWGW